MLRLCIPGHLPASVKQWVNYLIHFAYRFGIASPIYLNLQTVSFCSSASLSHHTVGKLNKGQVEVLSADWGKYIYLIFFYHGLFHNYYKLRCWGFFLLLFWSSVFLFVGWFYKTKSSSLQLCKRFLQRSLGYGLLWLLKAVMLFHFPWKGKWQIRSHPII